MTVLSAREGYRLWAPNYDDETVVSHLENEVVTSLGVATTGVRLLDAGCGTGRRLRRSEAQLAVGVDVSFDMLRVAVSRGRVAVADVRALPFGGASFDVVWCRLMIGHVPDPGAVYAELSRVCRAGGEVVVTDLSTEAVKAGHRRTFRDTAGRTHELVHHTHTGATHASSAQVAGLTLVSSRDGTVGPSVRRFYEEADRTAVYEMQQGMPLVTAMHFRKAV